MKYLWVNYSTHVVMFASIVLMLWDDPQFQALLPDAWRPYVAPVVLMAFIIAKAIPQGRAAEVEA